MNTDSIDKNAYSRIINVMQKASNKKAFPVMKLGEVTDDGRIQYEGLLLDEDDYTLISGALAAGDTCAVYKDGDEIYVIAKGSGASIKLDTSLDISSTNGITNGAISSYVIVSSATQKLYKDLGADI